MSVRIGCAAAPRWYDQSMERLPEFAGWLDDAGATAVELVLHPGEPDEASDRVHVPRGQWAVVANAFQQRGFACNAHWPLVDGFKLDHWDPDASWLPSQLELILEEMSRWAVIQAVPPVPVVHAAGTRSATASFLEWAAPLLSRSGASIAVELRRPSSSADQRFDRTRSSLAAFVRGLQPLNVGICWDIAHDWEAMLIGKAWTVQPDETFLDLVTHVHVHGDGMFDGKPDVHFPLHHGVVPWREMLTPLLARGYDGAITIEARYRYARTIGKPWHVLAESLQTLGSFLTSREPASRTMDARPTHGATNPT